MILCLYWRTLFMSVISFSFEVFSFNVSNINSAYQAVCGSHVCEYNTFYNISNMSEYGDFCGECSCDLSCIYNSNCCPDYFFSQLSCVETNFLRYNTERNDQLSVAMIVKCPDITDPETKQLCEITEDVEEQLQNMPVSSTKTGLTYRNIHCFKCHNESSSNVKHWDLEIHCIEFTDFNFISSYSGIIAYAKSRKCNMFYSHDYVGFPEDTSCGNNEPFQNTMSSCNVSGTWLTYDEDIDIACQIYDHKYHNFKNVICYMCNPPISESTPISRCNATGLWTPYNEEIQTACLQTISTPLTAPFKNIYCYLCNKNNTQKSSCHKFQEIEICSKVTQNDKTFVLQYSGLALEYKWLLEQLQLFSQPLSESRNIELERKYNKIFLNNLNVTNILENVYAFAGYGEFCHNYSKFSRLSNCDCSDHCYFKPSGCCIESLLKRSTTCTDPTYSKDRLQYLVYNTCSRPETSDLYGLCKGNISDDLHSLLPIALTLGNDTVHYKNIYCMICDDHLQHQSILNDTISINVWEINIECNVYIPVFYQVSFKEYFDLIRKNKCKIFYKPENNAVPCTRGNKLPICNVTRKWKTHDPDIEYACENVVSPYNMFKNTTSSVFCFICNPHGNEITYSTCNMTGLWNSYNNLDEDDCLKMPTVDYHAPYKNYFCMKCNGKGTFFVPVDFNNKIITIPVFITHKDTFNGKMFPSYREVFSFSKYRADAAQNAKTNKCNVSQMLLPEINRCFKLVCYPGRILVDSRCVPLLQTTKNLGYILYVGIKATLFGDFNDTGRFINVVAVSFKHFINNYLNVQNIEFEFSYIVLNQPSGDTNKWKEGSEVLISTYQKLFIRQLVNRSLIEKKLVTLPSTEFNISYKGIDISFQFYYDETTFHLPSFISKLEFTDICVFKENNNITDANLYIHSHVNKLLICEQIELDQHEFNVNRNTLQLTVTDIGQAITHDEYILTSFGKARLCLTRYLALHEQKEYQYTQDIWGVVQLMCSCLSLICLLFTFVTYCLFPTLRSLPGKNNMCLVFSMFCAQLSFQFVVYGLKSEVGCKIVGILIHYFWLVTFGCLSVCSFHMYRVFRSKTGMHFSEQSKLMIYILYSFGMPACIVILNVIITISISKDSSIGYGNNVCFLNHQLAFIITFVLPIALVCCSNLFFFIVTLQEIATTQKLKSDIKMQSNQINVIVYVKLFTITGITWILQVIDSFIPASAFSVIVSILNTLQGVFIFVSYICNRRVLNLYKRIRSSSNQSTKTIYRSSNKTMTTEFSSITN